MSRIPLSQITNTLIYDGALSGTTVGVCAFNRMYTAELGAKTGFHGAAHIGEERSSAEIAPPTRFH